jgi:hypothetical protein
VILARGLRPGPSQPQPESVLDSPARTP